MTGEDPRCAHCGLTLAGINILLLERDTPEYLSVAVCCVAGRLTIPIVDPFHENYIALRGHREPASS